MIRMNNNKNKIKIILITFSITEMIIIKINTLLTMERNTVLIKMKITKHKQ